MADTSSTMAGTGKTVSRAPGVGRRDMSTEAYDQGLKSETFVLPKGVTSLSESYQRFELDTQEEKELEKMAVKLEEDKRKYALLKDIRKKKQQAAMHARANELSKRMEDLEQEESNERFRRVELRQRLQNLRQQESEKEDRERELSKQLWELERDHAVEEIAQLRMKAAAIRNKRDAVTLQFDIAETHVQTIEEERLNRGQSNYQRLQEMLSHADTLQQQLDTGGFDDVGKAEAATKLLDQIETGKAQGEGGELYKLSDEVENMRKQQRERAAGARAAEMKRLNEQRRTLHERQLKLAKERREFRLIRAKGLDVLADIEFGDAPPMEYLLANATAKKEDGGEGKSDTDSEEEPLDEFVETTKENINKIKITMEYIKEEIPKIPQLKRFAEGPYDRMRPYGGEMGKRSYLKSQMPAYNLCRKLCLEIVDEAMFYLFVFRPTRKDAEKAVVQFQAKRKQRIRKEETLREDLVMRDIVNEIIDYQVADIAGSIAYEFDACRNKAVDLGLQLILGSFSEQVQRNRKEITNAFKEMIKRRDLRDEKSTSRRAHQRSTLKHISRHKRKTAEEVSREDQRHKAEDADKSKADREEEAREVDHDVTFIPTVSRTLGRPKLPLYYVEMERTYWERVTFNWQVLNLAQWAKTTGGLTALSISPDGRFLLTGHEKGSMLMFDTFWTPPMLIRASFREKVPKERQSPVVAIRWGLGGSGHRAATIDKAGIVRIWSTETIVKQNKHSALKDFFPKEMRDVVKKPPAPSLIGLFDPYDSARASNSMNDPALNPTSICFHPSITVSGQQPSLMIGMKKGLIVKHNLPSDGPILFEKSHAESDPANPLLKRATKDAEKIAAALKCSDCGNRLPPDVAREFFQSHSNKIIYLDFVGTADETDDPTTTLVSVDERGHVFTWPYTADGFSGFGWFVPSGKYKIRDHTTSPTDMTTLKIRKAVCNRARTQLILLCHANTFPLGQKPTNPKSGALRVLFFDLQTVRVLPWAITVAENISPEEEVGMCLSPLLDAPASDVLYITHNNQFEIYSLATGQPLKDKSEPFQLRPKEMATLMDVNPGNSCIFIGAVGGTKINFSPIEDVNTSVGRRDKYSIVKKLIANEGELRSSRIRRFSTGPEHRVRNIYWDISEHNVDREISGIVYEIGRAAAGQGIRNAIARKKAAAIAEEEKHQVAL